MLQLGLQSEDTKIAGEAHEAGKGIIIVVNKWDEIEKDTKTMNEYKKKVYNKLSYLTYAPILFISAKTGQRVNKLFELIKIVANQNAIRISTPVINQIINEAIAITQPPTDKGKRLKILYTTQVSTKPPTFVIFVNDKKLFHFSYERYLINQIRNNFNLIGTPIRVIARERKRGGIKMVVLYIVVGLIAYLLGSISFSVIFSKKFAGFDVRDKGSKNAGTTNVLRTVGKKAAAITLICDILKGVVAILVALIANKLVEGSNGELLVQIAGIFVILGHTFPIFFGFRGGKGIATALGVLLITNYQIGLICLVFALVIMLITRIVSIGSILAAILFPILTIFINENYIVGNNYIIFGILIALLVIFNHRANLKRILSGTENRLSFKKK